MCAQEQSYVPLVSHLLDRDHVRSVGAFVGSSRLFFRIATAPTEQHLTISCFESRLFPTQWPGIFGKSAKVQDEGNTQNTAYCKNTSAYYRLKLSTKSYNDLT